MCGIVGYVGKNNAVEILIDGLHSLQYRGYDSAGITSVERDEIQAVKTTEGIEDLKRQAEESRMKGTMGIGHTRWATHGRPLLRNAHPIFSQNGDFAVVHNGIIENFELLKYGLEAEGTAFHSDTDTEVIAALLEKKYSGDLLETVISALSYLKGSYALGIISTKHPDTLIAARQFSPLIIGVAEDGNYLASDISALLAYTRRIIYLEDGEIALLKRDRLSIYNRNGEKINKEPIETDISLLQTAKGEYDYYMMKEIKEQPTALRRQLEENIKNSCVYFKNTGFDKQKLLETNKIHLVACGSAYHASFVGKYIFEELLGIPTEVDTAGEYRYRKTPIDNKTLVLAVSQSGETADTIAAVQKAKNNGAYVISVVNVQGSTLQKISDGVIHTLAGPEISVATTKGYSSQLMVLYLFALWASEKLSKINEKEYQKLMGEIYTLPAKIEEIFCLEEKIRKLAFNTVQKDIKTIFFIGRNTDYAVALEASLKLKEISYINSSAYAAAELKHGTISLIEDGTVVAALCCRSELNEKMYSGIKEVKARGAYVISVTQTEQNNILSVSDQVLVIPKVHDLFSPSLEVIPFQLFAYYTAFFKGFDIDKPRNLAKSVTVE